MFIIQSGRDGRRWLRTAVLALVLVLALLILSGPRQVLADRTWEPVGNPGFSGGTDNKISLDVYEGTAYVAYRDVGNGYKATVMKFNGTSWDTVGSPGFSAGVAYNISLDVYGGTPYVAYSDGGIATVMKFNGASWEAVGSPGPSASSAYDISLDVYAGVPYVAYDDGGNGAKATVMRFNGTSWEAVGSPGFSAGAVWHTSLEVYEGTPYVAYMDVGNGSKATVMKFNGTSWETVGSPGFSAGTVAFTSLDVYEGTPYVAYRDAGYGYEATVMKFNGTSWETVGSPGFSAGVANYPSLDVYERVPYVAYSDVGNGNKATVMKFNGASWEAVGSPGLSASYAYDVSLDVCEGTPYVAYKDGGYGDRATVMKYASLAIAVDSEIVTATEGQAATNSGTVSDPGGAGLTLSASIGTVTDNDDGTWSWDYTTQDGPAESQTVTITADDGGGGIASVDFSLIVYNESPTVTSITVPLDPVSKDAQPISVSAVFSDPAGIDDSPFTCTVDYGDGSGQSVGTVTGYSCIGPGHTYAEAGVYPITVAVRDKDNETGSATADAYLVIYDADGGFVTGGGWFDSPEDAYRPNPTLTGKASFGFVSKYKRGATVPTGNTEFHFKVAGFNFHSDTYQWLVIAGAKAKFKGTGTINGTGDYGFMISAVDEKLTPSSDFDLFRIKIWEIGNGDTLVYDNQLGATDDADPTTAIGGGSIVVHKK